MALVGRAVPCPRTGEADGAHRTARPSSRFMENNRKTILFFDKTVDIT